MILRDDDGKEVALGKPGEICIRGPQVMAGYWQHPAETAKVLDKDGWFATGDIGVMDDQGFIKIVDRKKDMIMVSGFQRLSERDRGRGRHAPRRAGVRRGRRVRTRSPARR